MQCLGGGGGFEELPIKTAETFVSFNIEFAKEYLIGELTEVLSNTFDKVTYYIIRILYHYTA